MIVAEISGTEQGVKMRWSCCWLLDYGLVVIPFRSCPQPSILVVERSAEGVVTNLRMKEGRVSTRLSLGVRSLRVAEESGQRNASDAVAELRVKGWIDSNTFVY